MVKTERMFFIRVSNLVPSEEHLYEQDIDSYIENKMYSVPNWNFVT